MSKQPPDPEDSTVDLLSMIEVAERAYRILEAKSDNALDVQRRYAVYAILNGVPPEEVAHACGFGKQPEERVNPDMPDVIARMMGVPPTPTEMQRFTQWICSWLAQQILGYSRSQPSITTHIDGQRVTYTDLESDDDE